MGTKNKKIYETPSATTLEVMPGSVICTSGIEDAGVDVSLAGYGPKSVNTWN